MFRAGYTKVSLSIGYVKAQLGLPCPNKMPAGDVARGVAIPPRLLESKRQALSRVRKVRREKSCSVVSPSVIMSSVA